MVVPFSTLFVFLGDFIWNALRLSAFFMVVPIFGNQLISPRIKIALVLAVAAALTPILSVGFDLANIRSEQFLALGSHIVFSIGLGFSAAIFFQLFVIAGQFIGMQMGLGFAAMVDPGNGVQVTVWSQFFLMLLTLSFLAIDGHLVLLEVLIKGYQLVPAGESFVLTDFGWQVAAMGGWMFAGGLLLAVPAVVSLLIVNLAFGIMNRSAPQLNVFALGFPFSLLFGLVVIWFLLHGWGDQFTRLLAAFYELVGSMTLERVSGS